VIVLGLCLLVNSGSIQFNSIQLNPKLQDTCNAQNVEKEWTSLYPYQFVRNRLPTCLCVASFQILSS
jgi:hypothetical protein